MSKKKLTLYIAIIYLELTNITFQWLIFKCNNCTILHNHNKQCANNIMRKLAFIGKHSEPQVSVSIVARIWYYNY